MNAERQRSTRKLRANAQQVRREFNKLAADVNDALNTFNRRLAWILKEDTPGVVDNFARLSPDRSSPSTQETSKLEFS